MDCLHFADEYKRPDEGSICEKCNGTVKLINLESYSDSIQSVLLKAMFTLREIKRKQKLPCVNFLHPADGEVEQPVMTDLPELIPLQEPEEVVL